MVHITQLGAVLLNKFLPCPTSVQHPDGRFARGHSTTRTWIFSVPGWRSEPVLALGKSSKWRAAPARYFDNAIDRSVAKPNGL